MKTFPVIILILSMLLPSCVVAPFVIDKPDGSTTASMGGVLAARRKNTVAEITTRNGTVIKYMSEEEAGEDVPNNLIAGWTAKNLANIQGGVTKHEASVDSATTLGLDKGVTERAGIEAGVRGAENFNPNIPLPIRR